MRCLDGHFQRQLVYDTAVVKTRLIGKSKEENLMRLKEMGIEDPDWIYDADEFDCGETFLFAPCGITPGILMQGICLFRGGTRTHSLVISIKSKTARFIDTVH